MKAIELIRWALQMTDEGMKALVEDMRSVPLTMSTPGARGGDGNHPLWCVGHQAFLEAGIRKIILGGEHPLQKWAAIFAPGTTPRADASLYPGFDEVLRTYSQVRAGTLKLLEELGEDGLARAPKEVPPGFEGMMKTCGQTILLITLHQMVHYGQIADSRRVAGRKPLL